MEKETLSNYDLNRPLNSYKGFLWAYPLSLIHFQTKISIMTIMTKGFFLHEMIMNN